MFFDDIGISDCNGGTCTELLHVVTKLINIMVENFFKDVRLSTNGPLYPPKTLEYDVFTYKLLLSRENIRTF